MIHSTIKDQIKEALRAKDTIRLDTLRGLSALFTNEMINTPASNHGSSGNSSNYGNSGKQSSEFLSDEKALALIKKSIKQRKDSIEQFTKGGREDLASKERAELNILEAFMPAMMSKDEIKVVAHSRIEAIKAQGNFDPKSSGKIVGMIMKELAGKADGTDVKSVVEGLLSK